MCKSGMGGGCPHKTAKAVGLLALRLALGFIFMYTGYQKLWPGHVGAVGMFDGIGFPGSGSFWAYFVGTLEFVGGAMVILGAYARFAAAWLAVIMVVALLTVHRGGPVFGYFLPLSLLGGTLSLLGTGAGRYRVLKCECCCKACKEMYAEKDCGSGGCGGCSGGNCGGCGAEEDKKM